MKPTSIIFLVVSVLLIIAGLVCCQMASTMAETEQISLYSEQTDEDGNRINTVYFNSGEYDCLSFNFQEATVHLCRGDEEKVVLKNYTEGTYSSATSGVTYEISDTVSAIDMITSGSFNLGFKGLRHYWHDRQILSRKREVYIYTTQATDVNSLIVTLADGDVYAENYDATFDVAINITKGKAHLKNAGAASFNVTGKKCDVEAVGGAAQRFHTEVTEGKVVLDKIDVKSLCKIQIKEKGEARLSLSGGMEEYIVSAYASKGVSVNGENAGTEYTAGEELSTRTLDLYVTSGTATLTGTRS